MIISGQEAMVVDASLHVEVYRDFIENRNITLKYVVDTHVHADHLSRAKELAESFGLKPSIPKNDKLAYPFHTISDNTIFEVGEVQVKAIHTPGHTLESTSYLVDDKALLTGDTLFTNGVGRPDLKANEEEARQKESLLYHFKPCHPTDVDTHELLGRSTISWVFVSIESSILAHLC